MNRDKHMENRMPESELTGVGSSQDSGPMSFEEDDIFAVRKQPPANSESFSCTPNQSVSISVPDQPAPQYLENGLRSIQEIPAPYRDVFGEYPCFNRIQSMVMDVVFYSSEPLVVTAPTGSGKTVIFELAIIRLLMSLGKLSVPNDFKIIYMAPVKALCTEKLHDWARKFAKLNINCLEVTGDSDIIDLDYLRKHQLILTTPEKWDSLTRRWRDHASVMKSVRLFMIDEVHILNEETRGPTLEAVVSRMKMLKQQQYSDNKSLPSLRFIAVSATIPNVEDLAQWLGNHEHSAKLFKIGEEMRPVKLKKIVKGYESTLTGFMFDIHLNYKLKAVISQYSEGKPTLVFCSTRKSVVATAETLAKMITFSFTETQHAELYLLCDQIVDKKIRELVKVGIGCHHAGLVMSDRNLLETAFRDGLLPVLMATSTLAMGVNLPAHLVVVKSTQFYGNGGYQDYSDSQLLQMIGRAGRPQFDSSATAVIMTRASCQDKYERLTAGTEPIQSSLHRHLAEHLNAEVVLGTVTDLPAAVDWIRSTFLFVRANRHPQQYGLAVAPGPGSAVRINAKLQDMMQVELNALAKYKLVETNGMDVRDTPAGRLMARYYVAFQTMRVFLEVQGTESLGDLLVLLSKAAEFQDVQLRNDEKAALNALNSKKDGAPGLRFPIKGRIKDRDAKVNCLLQALLGGLHIVEPALQQEAARVARTAERLSKCLSELVQQVTGGYCALYSAMLLHKCVRCQLWETSPLAARQLPRIGPVLAQMLAAAGKTSLERVAASNPRDLERIVNRLPPFGNELCAAAAAVPQLTLSVERSEDALDLLVDIGNLDVATRDRRHWVSVLVGDNENHVLIWDRFPCTNLFEGTYSNRVAVSDVVGHSVTVHVISEMWIGVDQERTVCLREPPPAPASSKPQKPAPKRKPTLMDKILEVTSRMGDTPSHRPQANQAIGAGRLSLSQRFEQFRKTEGRKLQHGAEDDSEDPDDPPPSRTLKTAPPKAPVVDLTLDPWDEWDGGDGPDPQDVQVVPDDESWSPKPELGDPIEYSVFPNQPTIRNFFKPEPPASLPATQPEPNPRFDLDDSWDMDILMAAEGLPCDKSVTSSPEELLIPRTDEENWAGCWDINFDIGIEELLRCSDDEAKDNATVDACTAKDEGEGIIVLDEDAVSVDDNLNKNAAVDDEPIVIILSGAESLPDVGHARQAVGASPEKDPEQDIEMGDPGGDKRGSDEGVLPEPEMIDSLNELFGDADWMDDLSLSGLDVAEDPVTAPGVAAPADASLEEGGASESEELADGGVVVCPGPQTATAPLENGDEPRVKETVEELDGQDTEVNSGALALAQCGPELEALKDEEGAGQGEVAAAEDTGPQADGDVQVPAAEDSGPQADGDVQVAPEETVPCVVNSGQQDGLCGEEMGQSAEPRSPLASREGTEEAAVDETAVEEVTVAETAVREATVEEASVEGPLQQAPPAPRVLKEVFHPEDSDRTPRKEPPEVASQESLSKSVKEEHRLAKAVASERTSSDNEAIAAVAVKVFDSVSESIKCSPTTSCDRKEFKLVPDSHNASSLQMSQTILPSMAPARPSNDDDFRRLLKLPAQDPQRALSQPKDPVLAKLLLDLSNGALAEKNRKGRLPTAAPPADRAPPLLRGAVCTSVVARRTSEKTVTAVPADDKPVDCVERILQGDIPLRLLPKLPVTRGKAVRAFNTDRLRAAGLGLGLGKGNHANDSRCVLSQQLGKQLEAALSQAKIGGKDQHQAAAPGTAAVSTTESGIGRTQTVDSAPLLGAGRRRPQPRATQNASTKVARGSPPSGKAVATPSSAASSASAPDWFDRLLAQPLGVGGVGVHRPYSLLGARTHTAKRKAEGDAAPAPFKRLAIPSVWQQMAVESQAQVAPRPSQPAPWSGTRGALSATARRTPAAAPDAPRGVKVDAATPPAQFDFCGRALGRDVGELSTRRTPSPAPPALDPTTPPRRRAHHRSRARLSFGEDLSPIRTPEEYSQYSPPMPPPAPYFDREDYTTFEGKHRAADPSFGEEVFGFSRPLDSFDEDDDVWRDCPISASPCNSPPRSPPRSPQRRISNWEADLFAGHAEAEDNCASPIASFWARRGSPSYSPAPKRSLNWERPNAAFHFDLSPSARGRGRDDRDDPFAYVPLSTRASAPVPHWQGRDEHPDTEHPDWSRTEGPATSPSASSSKMILSLSPARRSLPPSSQSRWNGFLG